MELFSDNLKLEKKEKLYLAFQSSTKKHRCNPHSPICDRLLISLKRNKSQEMQLRDTGYFHLCKKNFAIAFVYMLYISKKFETSMKDSRFS